MPSVAREAEPPRPQVVCVDNGSTDGSADAIRAGVPGRGAHRERRKPGLRRRQQRRDPARARARRAVGGAAQQRCRARARRDPRPSSGPRRTIRAPASWAERCCSAIHRTAIWFAGQRVNTALGYSGRPRGYGRPDGSRYAGTVPSTGPWERSWPSRARPSTPRARSTTSSSPTWRTWTGRLRVREAGFEVLLVPGCARVAWRLRVRAEVSTVSTHPLYYGVRNTIVVCERHAPLGPIGKALRRAVIAASFGARALLLPNRRAALHAVRAGVRDALSGRLGIRPSE